MEEYKIDKDLDIVLQRLFVKRKDFEFPLKCLSLELIDKYILPKYVTNGEPYRKDWSWNIISQRKDLTDDFAEKYKDKIVWWTAIQNSSFSEDFLRRNLAFIFSQDSINYVTEKSIWMSICDKNDLSLEFVKENLNNIKYEYFAKNRKLGRSNKYKIREFFKNYSDLL
jgi:hypothetical protein